MVDYKYNKCQLDDDARVCGISFVDFKSQRSTPDFSTSSTGSTFACAVSCEPFRCSEIAESRQPLSYLWQLSQRKKGSFKMKRTVTAHDNRKVADASCFFMSLWKIDWNRSPKAFLLNFLLTCILARTPMRCAMVLSLLIWFMTEANAWDVRNNVQWLG